MSHYITRIHLPHEHIVLNTFKDVFPPKLSNPLKCRLRLLILFQTKYLYTCKSLSKRPDLEEFLSKLHQQTTVQNRKLRLIKIYEAKCDSFLFLSFFFFSFSPVVNSLNIKGKNNSIEIVATR